jgi:hypothetical protein
MATEIIKKAEEVKWNVTARRFVAFIDIMGFKDMVSRNSHAKIYEMMQQIDYSRKHNERVQWTTNASTLIKTTTYSDSIMIYSKDDSIDSLRSLVYSVSGLSNDLLFKGIPHKGAVALGEMTLDYANSIFFGQPLIDAYLLQDELVFYGIVVHATAEEEIDKANQEKKTINFVKRYLCPFKAGSSYHLTIYPLYSDPSVLKMEKYTEDGAKLSKSVTALKYRTSGHLRKYVDNTETYLKMVRDGA